ncbi:MAG: 4Fe-4S binding protein [Planctomycetota bacterium]|jgi:ferredoxin
MSLEREIKDFMKSLGVDVVGLAGPGRFDGPPSLDPEYVLKGAKSVIAYALPLDVEAIYAYLKKETGIKSNLDQIRVHQRAIHAGLKLMKFLEEKGYRAAGIPPNVDYRKDLRSTLATMPKFSHRYASYVSGIAAPGISGNAVTKEYGASQILNSVVTDAELESDPMLGPRHVFDGRCRECMTCTQSCPPKMFMKSKEEYALINGELYPRGKKRDINLCAVSCGGMHSISADKTWSSWGKSWLDSWTGKEPDPETQNILKDMLAAFGFNKDLVARISPAKHFFGSSFEEGYFEESGPFPSYEQLEGETEGQKLRSYAGALEPLVGNAIADPLSMTCCHCQLICGPTTEEAQKRWKMLSSGGILCYKENNEPYIARDYREAAEIRKKHRYQIKRQVEKESVKGRARLFFKNFGIDWHTVIKGRQYRKKLARALAENGLPPQKV